MKSQTLGLVLVLNVAVACLALQGCKANKPGNVKPSQEPVVVVPEEEVAPEKPAEEKPVVKDVPDTPVPPKEVKPVAPVTPVTPVAAETTSYVVRAGDTLSGIAARYNIKLSAILSVNPGLNPNRIFVGRKIKLPGKIAIDSAAPAPAKKSVKSVEKAPTSAAKTTAPAVSKKPVAAYKGATKNYTVKNGDILGKIAYENGITVSQLKELNGLKSSNIRVGQVLKVPAEKIVKKSAAKKPVKVDVAEEKAVEPKKVEEKKEEVKPVEEAKPVAEPAPAPVATEPVKTETPAEAAPAAETATAAPAAETAAPAATAEAAPSTYVVKEGQDIITIAVDFNISPTQLLDINNLKMTDTLKPGDVLKLPPGVKQPTAQ